MTQMWTDMSWVGSASTKKHVACESLASFVCENLYKLYPVSKSRQSRFIQCLSIFHTKWLGCPDSFFYNSHHFPDVIQNDSLMFKPI